MIIDTRRPFPATPASPEARHEDTTRRTRASRDRTLALSPARAPRRHAQLKAAADKLDAWPLERDAALGALRRGDAGELVAEGDVELAWQAATTAGGGELERRGLPLAWGWREQHRQAAGRLRLLSWIRDLMGPADGPRGERRAGSG